MPRTSIPYPPSPKRVPPDLTDPGRDSAARVIAVVGGLFLFLVVYVGFIVFTLALIVAILLWFRRLPYPVLWVLVAVVASVFSLLLLKGLLARPAQTTAAVYLRKKEKKPHLGLPPALDGPHDGEDIRLFDPDTRLAPGDSGGGSRPPSGRESAPPGPGATSQAANCDILAP